MNEEKEINEILEDIQNFVNGDTWVKYFVADNKKIMPETYAMNFNTTKKILDYIINLQEENQKLKEQLNCKEYFSSTMPEDTEFVILTKNNYDRQQKDLALENIELKQENEKLKELCDKYEEEHNNAFKLWTMKMEEMPDYEEKMKLKQENQKLNKIIDELERWLKEDEEEAAITWEMGRCFNMFDILNKLTELKKEVE